MNYIGDYAEDFATLNFKFTSRQFSTGAPFTLAGTPSLAVYVVGSTTESTAGIALTVDYDAKTGLNDVVIDLSADAFYAVGKDYEVVIAAGTVDSVSVVGEVLAVFSIENRTTFPKADMPTNFAAMGISVGGVAQADVVALNGIAAAAVKLALSAGTMVAGTVDDTAHTPTTTEFEVDDITEATADHYIGRVILFTSGALSEQATAIVDYALVTGRGHFTVSAMTEAPANNDTFIIV